VAARSARGVVPHELRQATDRSPVVVGRQAPHFHEGVGAELHGQAFEPGSQAGDFGFE